MPTRVLLFVLLAGGCFAQEPVPNLDFEQGSAGEVPPGWFVPNAAQAAGYTAIRVTEGCRTGSCAMIAAPAAPAANSLGNVMRNLDAVAHRGKQVVLRAAVRVEGSGTAAMWLRVDIAGGGMGFFDNMNNRRIRAGDWNFYEIRGTVDAGAQSIAFGVMLIGAGRAWVDDVSLTFLDRQPDGPELAAARSELAKLYAAIDRAYAERRLDVLEAMAAPGARFGSSFMQMPLAQAMASLRKALESLSKLSTKTEITDVAVFGDEAKVRTRSLMETEEKGVRTLRETTNYDTWVKADGTWRLREALSMSSRELVPPADPESVRALAAELRKNVVPLAGVEAGKPYADLEAFGKAVGDARVVALGEATHGTREIFQMKHRLLEYLVKEKGFTVFAIEANWPESQAADRYIKTGEGDPKAALRAMYFWTWQTEEVLAMLEWMREFNRAPGKHPILTFTAFDMQTHDVARARVVEFVKQHAPADAATVEAAYAPLLALGSRTMGDPGFEEAAKKAAGVTELLLSRRAALEKATSPAAFRDVVQMSRIAAQAAAMRAPNANSSYRDEMMARNTKWLLEEAHPGEKIVLWAHNGHLSTASTAGFRPMGSWLRESLGRDLYVLGFAVHNGSVRAMTREGGKAIGLKESKLPPVEPGTGTAALSEAKIPLFFLDLRGRTGALGKWIAGRQLFRELGAVWDRDAAASFMRPTVLAENYDGLIFMESTTAARGL